MPWITRGLRDGIVTTRYPRRPDGYGPSFQATVEVHGSHAGASVTEVASDLDGAAGLASVASKCPTGAIRLAPAGGGAVRVDRGRCITCGRCVAARPDLFRLVSDPEVARPGRSLLVVPESAEDLAAVARRRAELLTRVRALRRSVHVRHVDCGSDGSEEWEVAALTNPVYDVQRLGIYFTASPRHADVLLVTGAGSTAMLGPLRRTFEAMPSPKVVVAVGTDSASGGLFRETSATSGGVGTAIAVDVYVPGSPPSPFAILHGILLAVGLLEPATTRPGAEGPR